MKVTKLFNKAKEKYGSVFWDDTELAITQKPYPIWSIRRSCFTAAAMDLDGNLWDVTWYPKANAEIEDWDKPDVAILVEEGYYLDD